MPPIVSKCRPRLSYSARAMEEAVLDVQAGLGIRAAASLHCVPKSTLSDNVSGKTRHRRRLGKLPVLSKEEEETIVEWIHGCCRRGLPPHRCDVFNSVQEIIQATPDRLTTFKKGRPGNVWFQRFSRRHPNVIVRTRLKSSSIPLEISKHFIRNWFADLQINLKDAGAEEAMKDPSRVYSSREINVEICPSTGKVIGTRMWKNAYACEKKYKSSTLTFLCTVNAVGDVVVPALVFPYAAVTKDVVRLIPPGFHVATNESGWMKAETFCKWLVDAFDPWLSAHDIRRPIVLFVDGHKTHLSLQVSNFCDSNGIFLCRLPPNASHFMQAVNVEQMEPLNDYLKHGQHRSQNLVINVANIAPIFHRTMKRMNKFCIINGFKTSGLFPLCSENVEYTKCLGLNNISMISEETLSTHPKHNLPKIKSALRTPIRISIFNKTKDEKIDCFRDLEKEFSDKPSSCSNRKLQEIREFPANVCDINVIAMDSYLNDNWSPDETTYIDEETYPRGLYIDEETCPEEIYTSCKSP